MQKISILFSLLGSLCYAATDIENSTLKGVLIVDDSSKIRQENLDRVQGVQFDGVVQNEELVEELTPFLSQLPLTGNGAEELCQTISNYYLEHEDLRVAVTVPDQGSSTGVVQLVIAPEKLGRVQVKDNQYASSESVAKWVRLSPSQPINQKVVAQDLGWINSNPYRTVKANYQNTDQFGVTDLDLVVSDRKNWKILSGVENTGTMPIGTTRIFAGFDVNNFIFQDHILKFKATTTDHWKDYQSYKAEYIAMLPWRNTLTVKGSYSGTTPNRQPYPRKHKESFETSARYAIPQWLGSNSWVDKITYEAGFDFKGTNINLFFEDEPAAVEKKLAFIGQFVANVRTERSRNGSKFSVGMDLVGSPAEMLPHQTDADFDNLRKNATAQYLYSKLAMKAEQAVYGGWKVALQGRGQYAFADLIPSEQFSLGGYSTVRGYDEKVVSGDHAVCGNLELKAPEFSVIGVWYPKFGDKISFLGFVDGGYAWYRTEVEKTPLEQGLLSAGPGMRYNVASNFTSRLDVGFPMMKVEKSDKKPHIHFNASLSY